MGRDSKFYRDAFTAVAVVGLICVVCLILIHFPGESRVSKTDEKANIIPDKPVTPTRAARRSKTPAEVEHAETLLKSDIVADQQEGVRVLMDIAADSPKILAANLPRLLKPLIATKAYSEIDQLCLAAILERPQDTANIVAEQRGRVEALLASGKNGEALTEARRFYDEYGMLFVQLSATSNLSELLVCANGLRTGRAMQE